MPHPQITHLPLSDLKPNPFNPRVHGKKQTAQIAKSIETFGFLAPVLIDANRQIIAGHGRVLAAELLRIKEVPVIVADHLTEEQVRLYMIADNKLTENATWDEKLLAENLKILSDLHMDIPLDITGFEMGEIDAKISGLSAVVEGMPDPADQIAAIEKTIPVSKPGDLWILGQHRVFCGDALDQESFNKLMQGEKAHLIFIDPPYNLKINGFVSGLGAVQHREFAMASGEMSPAEFVDFLTKIFIFLAYYSVNGSIHYVCMDFRNMREILQAGHDVYKELKNLCVWVKDNAGMGAFYRSQHELVFVFKNGKESHKNNFQLGQHGRYRTNVWQYPGANSFSRKSDGENLLEHHPTCKPIALVADAIMDTSDRGDIVLDCFLGSGTTILAAERAGRKGYGIEIDPLYVDTAIRRWQKLTGQEAIHAETGATFNATEAAHV